MRVAVTLEQCWHRVPGGTARATLDAVAAVARRGDVEQVGVAARHRRPPEHHWTPVVDVAQLPVPRSLLYETWHRLRRPVVEVSTGPVDVVHATAHVAPGHRAPLVATVHDLHFLHEPGHFTPRGVRTFRRFLEIVRREAAAVVCPSAATAADCEAAGVDRDRVHVVPWGIDPPPPPVAGAAEAVRRRYGLGDRYVLFVGTVEPRKNLDRLIAAHRRLGRADVELVVVGPEGWGERDGRADGVEPRRLGFVPGPDLDALYRGASVVCYPSLREGFGLPVLEALARGVPVVTSAGTATAEVAGDAALLVDPLDVDAIAGALASVLDDRDLDIRLRAAGARRAGAFTWDRTASGLVAVYREVAR